MSADLQGVDLRWRPHGYFWARALGIQLVSDIKGAERRKLYEAALEQGLAGRVAAALPRHALSDGDRRAQGRIHPDFMGGEYLPDLRDGEVEIARITIASTTQDVVCVYARPVGRRIHYRVVDEYSGDTLEGRGHRTSMRPLTLGQLADFLLAHWSLNACLDGNFGGDTGSRDEVHDFIVDASSSFYAQFGALVHAQVEGWLDTQPGFAVETDPECGADG